MADKLLKVTVINPRGVVFEGSAQRVIMPGEDGVFEVLAFHKRLLSRLLTGTVIIDEQTIPIYRGVVRVGNNDVTIIMEQERQ